jgi:hypothetical protein
VAKERPPVKRVSEVVGGRAARVLNTGIALVHAGELVLPAAGSEAQGERVAEDAASVIHYYFPVEIEVRAAPDALDPEEVVSLALSRLGQRLESMV